jgi:hypothetical protein
LWSLGVGTGLKGTAGTWSGSTFYAPTSSVNLISTSGATLYITGVQLEAGEQASGFEFMPFDIDLMRCQRYYQIPPTTNLYAQVVNRYISTDQPFAVYMRATPTITNTFQIGAGATQTDQAVYNRGNNGYGFYTQFSVLGGNTGGNETVNVRLDAEL